MKDLAQWLVDRVQTVKQADAVTGMLADAGTDAIHAAQKLNFNPRTNPLLAGLKPRYTAGQGVRDLGNGIGRSVSETVRTVMPGMGHNGFNSVGDNFLQAARRSVAAVPNALGSFAGGDSAKGWKTLSNMNDGWDIGKMFSEPFDRAGRNPDGYVQSLREMGGLFQRWQPKVLYGDTLSSQPLIGKFLPGGAPRSFWDNWLGKQHMGKDISSVNKLQQSGDPNLGNPAFGRPDHF